MNVFNISLKDVGLIEEHTMYEIKPNKASKTMEQIKNLKNENQKLNEELNGFLKNNVKNLVNPESDSSLL